MRRLYPVNPGYLLWCVAAFLLVTGNFEFFQKTLSVYGFAENAPFLISLSVVLLNAIVFFVAVFCFFLPIKFVAAFFVVLGATAGYFIDNLGIVIDTEMIRNIFVTDAREVADLLNLGLLVRVAFLGVLPAIVILLVPIKPSTLLVRQAKLVGTMALSLLVMVIFVLPFSDAYASYVREHKPLRYFTNPTYPVYSAVKFIIELRKTISDQTFQTRVETANIPANDVSRELVIAVIGETARADHFGLNGYSRQTTPKLSARRDLVSFGDMKSCGTSTAASLPCMFSLDGREDFVIDRAGFTENVIDVLIRAGVSVLWRDNNSGSQGVADRAVFQRFKGADQNTVCDEEECRDIGMLAGLEDFIAQQDGDILIVLHQIGSHGPAYYKRYPSDFAVFTPDCQTQELANCANEEIVNAYDNTILYTDSFLNSVIEFLEKKQKKYETSMLYLSDHGESLGEVGVYLHGMPYPIAPDAQTNVPFIIWAGESSDIDMDRLRVKNDQPLTHDDFSKLLLEAFEVIVDGKRQATNAALLPNKPEEDER